MTTAYASSNSLPRQQQQQPLRTMNRQQQQSGSHDFQPPQPSQPQTPQRQRGSEQAITKDDKRAPAEQAGF